MFDGHHHLLGDPNPSDVEAPPPASSAAGLTTPATAGSYRYWVATMPGYNDDPHRPGNASSRTARAAPYYARTWEAAIASNRTGDRQLLERVARGETYIEPSQLTATSTWG